MLHHERTDELKYVNGGSKENLAEIKSRVKNHCSNPDCIEPVHAIKNDKC